MTIRLIAVKYLPHTNTRGARYRVYMAGHKPVTYGAGQFTDGDDESLQAARKYFDATHKDAQMIEYARIAHPIERARELLYSVHYIGAR